MKLLQLLLPYWLCIFKTSSAWSTSSIIASARLSSKSSVVVTSASPSDSCSSAISIRDCEYSELPAVSDIILESFYDEKAKKGPWKRVYRLAELNRLQQNFPYQEVDLHQMLVAVDDGSGMVVGFVDIDARPCKTKLKLPRPYLSDLCIHPDFRRRGIANRLVQSCEEFACGIPRSELWIRVKEENAAAVQMYKNLNYSIQGTDEQEPGIVILHKEFEALDRENGGGFNKTLPAKIDLK